MASMFSFLVKTPSISSTIVATLRSLQAQDIYTSPFSFSSLFVVQTSAFHSSVFTPDLEMHAAALGLDIVFSFFLLLFGFT
jgi:hypothetical protein